MSHRAQWQLARRALLAASLLACSLARADAVTDWNVVAGEVLSEARLGTPPTYRVLAIMHTAIYEAVNGITKRYQASSLRLEAAPEASVDAAIAAASRAALAALVPSQRAAIDRAYDAALAPIADGAAKSAGIAAGDRAAAEILKLRADDGSAAGESYRPYTAAGVYVPTTLPVFPQWPQRTPWLMTSAAQFRPGPPPALTSAVWTRDYEEVKSLGGKSSTRRTDEQTSIARFWEATLPPIYHGVVRSVATTGGREPTRNARLFMAVTQATDDAVIAILDAKYQYGFWRPITAIRNGDIDGNDATERDPSWTPFIDTPMHPEYPCGHCIVASTVATVLQAELGAAPVPRLMTTSSTANGSARSWTTLHDFVEEVSNARIYDGVHYRNSTEVATAMGRQIGALAAARYLRPSE